MDAKLEKKQRLTLFIFCFVFVLFYGPLAKAADATAPPATEQGAPEQLQAITSGNAAGEVKVTALITVTNASNNRYLGGVKITVDKVTTFTTQDPPAAEGHRLTDLTSGKHEIVAERAGYQIYDENITVPKDKQYYSLTLKMKPGIDTPVVDSNYFQKKYGTNYSGYPNNYTQNNNQPVAGNPWNNNQNNNNANNGCNNYNANGLLSQDSFSQNTIIDINGQSNFVVTRAQNGDYIIYNRINSNEHRHMYFTAGGVVFFSASVEINLAAWQMGCRPTGWFVSTYTKGSDGNAVFPTGIFRWVATSPSTYGQNPYGQSAGNNSNAQTGSSGSTTSYSGTSNTPPTIATNSCVKKSDIWFCFTEENSRVLAINGNADMSSKLQSIADRINGNASAMRDDKGKPDFVILANKNDAFFNKVGTGTIAAACLPVISPNTNPATTGEVCTDMVNRTFNQDQTSNLFRQGGQLQFIVISSETDLAKVRLSGIVIDHEWAHMYDYQSDFKGTVAEIFDGLTTKPTQATISANKKYDFAKFFGETNVKASEKYDSLVSSTGFKIEETLKDFPYCVYGAMNDYLTFDPTEISTYTNPLKLGGKLPVNRPEEVFAYMYSIVKDKKVDSFNIVYANFNADAKCAENLTSLRNQYTGLFDEGKI